MNTVLKVILIVVGLIFLLVVAAGVGGYFWWKHNKGTLMESVKAVSEEGSHFGVGTDNTGCLEEAIARIKKNGSLGDQIKAGLFLDYCLKSSKPSPGFCDDVPPADEIMKSVAWRIQMSRKYNLDGTRANILQSMEKYSDECRKKTK